MKNIDLAPSKKVRHLMCPDRGNRAQNGSQRFGEKFCKGMIKGYHMVNNISLCPVMPAVISHLVIKTFPSPAAHVRLKFM